jgi:putative heme-binding domain-containing protein
VQGDADFRPTGMAVAPDGSLYFGDWVLRDYPVHGNGRIWRLVLPDDEIRTSIRSQTEEDQRARSFRHFANTITPDSDDRFLFASGVYGFSREKAEVFEKWGTHVPEIRMSKGLRLTKLQARRLRGIENPEPFLRDALRDDSADVRLYAVRWIADERITSLRDEVAKLLDGPQPNSRYYLAVLAAVDWLDHEPKMRGRDIADELLVEELKNERRSYATRTLALRALSPNNRFLTLERLREYIRPSYAPFQLEAVRTLTQQSDPERFQLLATVAQDAELNDEVRSEAIMGLAPAAEKYRELLEQFVGGNRPVLKHEADRVLRLAKLRPASAETKPPRTDLAAWHRLLKEPADVAAGRRLFFGSVGARCAICHQHNGRGGRIGPDLTHVGRDTSSERIIESILQPSNEIAPHYQPWLLTTTDGRTLVGLRIAEGDDGTEEYADTAGDRFTLKSDEIESREASPKSIMPDGLESSVSIADLRDLVTFLTADP